MAQRQVPSCSRRTPPWLAPDPLDSVVDPPQTPRTSSYLPVLPPDSKGYSLEPPYSLWTPWSGLQALNCFAFSSAFWFAFPLTLCGIPRSARSNLFSLSGKLSVRRDREGRRKAVKEHVFSEELEEGLESCNELVTLITCSWQVVAEDALQVPFRDVVSVLIKKCTRS